MKTDYLEEFVELAYCLNFSKAAKKLDTSQSSISKHIQLLEKQYGIPLLERDTANVELTPFGIAVFQEAVTLVEGCRRFEKKVEGLCDAYRNNLVVGGMHYVPRAMKLLRRAQQAIENAGMPLPIQFKTALTSPIVDSLLDGVVDVAVMIDNGSMGDHDDLHTVPLFSDRLVALMPADHPLAGKDAVSLADLSQWTLIRPSGSYLIQGNSVVQNLFERHGLELTDRVVFTNQIHDLFLVDFADCVSVLEESLTGMLSADLGLTWVPITDEDAAFDIVVSCRADDANAVRFVDAVKG